MRICPLLKKECIKERCAWALKDPKTGEFIECGLLSLAMEIGLIRELIEESMPKKGDEFTYVV